MLVNKQSVIIVQLDKFIFSYITIFRLPAHRPFGRFFLALFPLYSGLCIRCVKRYLTDFDLQELSEQNDFVIKKGWMNEHDQHNSTTTLPHAVGYRDHPNDSSAIGRVGGVLSCSNERWEERSHR